MLVGDFVDERDHQVEARHQHRMELAEAFDHPGVLLRHHAHALGDDDGDDDKNDQRDNIHLFFS